MTENEHLFKSRGNQVILVLVYISVFVNSIVLMKEPAEIYIGYVGMIILLPFWFLRYGVPSGIGIIFGILFVTGLLNVYLDSNTMALFLKIFIGLFLSYLFYYYVIRAFEFSIEKLFRLYLIGAYIVAVIGIIQLVSFLVGFEPGYDFRWFLNKGGFVPGGNFGIRINSIFGEPTYLATTMSPAFFVAVYSVVRRDFKYLSLLRCAVIIVVYLLSFSGIAYGGVMITVLLLLINFGLIRYILIFIPIFLLVFTFLYNNVEDFRERYEGTIEVFSTGTYQIGKTHGSSIILYNNYHIATENFKENFLFGTGLGSHPIAFDRFSITKDVKAFGFALNQMDANSMLLRLISETGLFGTVLFLYIFFRCFVKRHEDDPSFPKQYWIISASIFVLIALNLLRQGHYFLNGFPFFVWLYYYNYSAYCSYITENKQAESIEPVVSGTV